MINLLKLVNFLFVRQYLRLILKPGRNFKPGYLTRFERFREISIGSDFFCGPLCQISASPNGKIRIGDSVMFGPGVLVLSGNHKMNSTESHMRFSGHSQSDKGIIIENGAWIGANAIILDGAHIGEGTVIGAGSVVSKAIPPYSIAAGSPAKIIRRRMEGKDIETLLKKVNSTYSAATVAQAETLNRDQK